MRIIISRYSQYLIRLSGTNRNDKTIMSCTGWIFKPEKQQLTFDSQSKHMK